MADDEQDEGGGEGWLVSYADLMTLLFAAFVVLYGITPRGQSNEILGIASSIREAFIEVPDEIEDVTLQAEIYNGKLSFKEAVRDSEHNPAIKRFNRRSSPLHEHTRNLNEVEVLLNQALRGDGLHNALRQATFFEKYELGLHLRLVGLRFFEKNQTDLTADSREYFRSLLPAFERFDGDLIIEGHASSSKGDRMQVFEVASRRAASVRRFLIENGNFKGKVRIASYGDLRPFDTDHGKEYDRVEIKLSFDELYK